MKATALNEDLESKILFLIKQQYTAPYIAKELDIPTRQVYRIKAKNHLTKSLRPIFIFNSIQEQILLSGILGDGNYKSNGRYGYYYRESHAENEIEYLKWKANKMQPFVSKSEVHEIKGLGFNKQRIFEFTTKTSESFAKYSNMQIEKVINLLDLRGLILFYLDDGWLCKKNICISGGCLTKNQKELVIKQFKKYGINSCHLVGRREDFCFLVEDYEKMKNFALSFLPQDLDIIKKKFKI